MCIVFTHRSLENQAFTLAPQCPAQNRLNPFSSPCYAIRKPKDDAADEPGSPGPGGHAGRAAPSGRGARALHRPRRRLPPGRARSPRPRHAAAGFLDLLITRTSFPVRAIQVDGGPTSRRPVGSGASALRPAPALTPAERVRRARPAHPRRGVLRGPPPRWRSLR